MGDIVITPASNDVNSTAGTLVIRTSDAQAMSLKTNDTDRIFIASAGKVGIGTATNISGVLHVNSPDAGNQTLLVLHHSAGYATNTENRLDFFDDETHKIAARIAQYYSAETNNRWGLKFYTNSQTAINSIPALTLLGRNAVGIGTANPNGMFHVHCTQNGSGEVYFTSNTGNINQNNDSPKLILAGEYQTAGVSLQAVNVATYGRKDLVILQHDANDYVTAYEAMRLSYGGTLTLNATSKDINVLTLTSPSSATLSNNAVLDISRGGGAHKGSAIRVTSANYSDSNKQAFIELNAAAYGGANTRYINCYDNDRQSFVVLANARVGIGTASPGAALEVSGSAIIGSSTYNSSYGHSLRIPFGAGDLTDGTLRGHLQFDSVEDYSVNGGDAWKWKLGAVARPGNAGNYNSQFEILRSTRVGVTDNPDFVINRDGNIGIGMRSPTNKIQISGGGISFTTSTGLAVQMIGIVLPTNIGYIGPYNSPADGNSPTVVALNNAASVQQTWFYSSGRIAMSLNREGRFHIGNLNNAPNCLLSVGPTSATTAVSGMCFGNDASANLYRLAAGQVKTDGQLVAVGGFYSSATAGNYIETLNIGTAVIIEGGVGEGLLLGDSSRWMIGTSDAAYTANADGDLHFRDNTNSVTRMIINYASGFVGIGTTSPSTLLNIHGTNPFVRINNTSADDHGIKISYNNSDTHGLHLLYNANSAVSYIDNTYPVLSTFVYGDIYFRQNVAGAMTTRMTIKGDGGNVGIGTTSPAYRLDVRSTAVETVAQFRGLNDTTIIIGGNDAGRGGEQYITYQNADTAGAAWMVGMDDGEDFRFAYGLAGEIDDAKTKVKIGQDGNVGIGTTDPLAPLHVGLGGDWPSSTGTSAMVFIKQKSSNVGLVIQEPGNASFDRALHLYTNGSLATIDATYRDTGPYPDIAFVTSGTERVRINSAGNVLIRTTTSTTNGGLLQIGQVPNTTASSIGFNNEDNAVISAKYNLVFQIDNTNSVAGRAYEWNKGGKGYGDGTNLMTLNAAGKLGIGTASPTTLLSVGGAGSTSAASGITFGGDAQANLYRVAEDSIQTDGNLYVAGTTVLQGDKYLTTLKSVFLVARGTGGNNNASRYLAINNTVVYTNTSRGLRLTIINATNLAVVSNTDYDTYGSDSACDDLATAINGMTSQQIGVLTSYDAWERDRASLRTAALNVGLTKLGTCTTYAAIRKPYAAIFNGTSDTTNATTKHVIERMDSSDADASRALITTYLTTDGSYASIDAALHMPNALYASDADIEYPIVAVNSVGNVGIGTTNPLKLLHVHGTNGEVVRLSMASSYTAGYGPQLSFWNGAQEELASIRGAFNETSQGNRANLIFGTRTSDTLGVETKMTILHNGNVGIGTTDPTHKLDVRGDVVVKGGATQHGVIRFRRSDSTTDFGYIGFENPALANDTFLISSAGNGNPLKLQAGTSDEITFFGNTIEYGRFNTNGYFGIGTNTPTTLLSVGGPGSTSAASGITLGGDASANLYRSASATIKTDGALIAGTYLRALNYVQLLTNLFPDSYTDYLRLNVGNSAGNAWENYPVVIKRGVYVGIGTDTPSGKLHVVSSIAGETVIRADGTNGTLFTVVDDLSDSLMSVNNSAGLPVLEVFADDRVVAGQYGSGDFVLVNNKIGIGTTNPVNKLSVIGGASIGSTTYNTTAPANGLIVQGNVGIGLTNPSVRLEVYSTASTIANFGGNQVSQLFYLGNSSATSYSDLIIRANDGQAEFFRAGNGYGSWGGASALNIYNSNGPIAFHPNNTANSMFLSSDGYLGIGVTVPAEKLDVRGGIIRSNARISNSEGYPLGHYAPGETVFEIDPTWSQAELQKYFNSSSVTWAAVADAPGGYCIYINGGVNVGGFADSGFPYIPVDTNDIFYMECWIQNVGTSQGHYMGSQDFDHNFADLGGNPGSYGYWVMSNYNPTTTWTKVSGYISGFSASEVGKFKTGTKYWTPQALFNYTAGTGTRACRISGWKVIKVYQVGDRSFAGNVNVAADLYVADELAVGLPITAKRVNYGAQINAASASIQLVFGRSATSLGSGAIGADENNTFGVYNVSGGITKQFSVTQQGNVGIGNLTPTSKLYIEGGSANWSETTPGTALGTIHLDPGVTTDDFGNAITFGASDSADGTAAQAGIYVRSDGGYGTKMYFATTDSYGVGSKTRMFISHSGNVGIATTNPIYKLQIGNFTSTSTNSTEKISLGGTFSNTPGSNIKMRVYEDAASIGGMSASSGQMEINTWSAGKIAFYRATTQMAVFNADGNLGIGNVLPNGARVHIKTDTTNPSLRIEDPLIEGPAGGTAGRALRGWLPIMTGALATDKVYIPLYGPLA